MQLGKALNDPVKGITALSKAGVSFTKEQKDQIKGLVEHGKTPRGAEDHPARARQGVRRRG
jgi:hypothetical protein